MRFRLLRSLLFFFSFIEKSLIIEVRADIDAVQAHCVLCDSKDISLVHCAPPPQKILKFWEGLRPPHLRTPVATVIDYIVD